MLNLLRNKKIILFISIFVILFLSIFIKYTLATNNSIYLNGEKTDKFVSIRYDINITDQDIASAQQLNPACIINTWTLDTGYGSSDLDAVNFNSQGNTNNIEKPITEHNQIFNESNGFDVLNTNNFDRVMLKINFFGQNGECQINYPIVANPILFSSFPYSF
jgi:hypothetical protein